MNSDHTETNSQLPDTQQIQEDLSMVRQALHSADDENRIHRMIVAWGNAVTALFLLMLTPIFLIVVAIVGASDVGVDETLIVGVTMLIPILLLLLLSLPFLFAAYGLFQGKTWGPGASVVAGVLNLLNFPLGSALAIYTFVMVGQGKLREPVIPGSGSVSLNFKNLIYAIVGVILFGTLSLTSIVLIGRHFDWVEMGELSILKTEIKVNGKSGVKGSGVMASEEREATDFRVLSISVPAKVHLSQGEPAVHIETEDNLLPLIVTKQEGDRMSVFVEKSFSTTKPITVRLQSRDIDAVSVSGTANLVLDDIHTRNLSIDANGTAKVSGHGTSERLTIECRGAASVMLPDLPSKHCKLRFHGVANGTVFASESLDAVLYGAGQVRYRGNPENVSEKVHGVGRIIKD